jgi:hypothetical protein
MPEDVRRMTLGECFFYKDTASFYKHIFLQVTHLRQGEGCTQIEPILLLFTYTHGFAGDLGMPVPKNSIYVVSYRIKKIKGCLTTTPNQLC